MNTMKSFGLVLMTGIFMLFMTSCSQQQGNKTAADLSGEQVITGEVLDMSCYMDHGAKGEGHKSCAQSCLDKGLPAGILAENGQVYLLVENHDAAKAYAKAIEHAAETVEISGTVVNKNGMQALVVEKVQVGS